MAACDSGGIVEAFSRIVTQRATDPVIVSTAARATFGEIDRLSQGVAVLIVGAALEPGSLIGFSAPNGPAFLAGVLGIRRACHTPVLLDPLAPLEDRQRALTAIGAASALTCATGWPDSVADFQFSPGDHVATQPAGRDIAAVKLTSGSTGVPRGVAMRDQQMLADEDALARTMGFRDSDRLLCSLPLSHSYGFTTLALSAIVRGLPLILPSNQGPFAPLDAAHDLGATIFPTVPAYLQALLKVSQPPEWPRDIRLMISAGAVLPAATAVQFRETYGLPLHVFYGSSECGGICYDRTGGAAERGTVGTAVEGVTISLTAIDSGDAGEGLVTVMSPAVGHTYLPDPDDRLADGCFETSDVAAWQNGELTLRRRIDHVINLRGRKVDPSEVEGVLAALDGVDEAVVIGVISPDGGGEMVRAVVASASGHLNYERVSAWCRQRLAEHKIPRSIIIVAAIPRTSRGKVDRAALMKLGTPNDSGAARA